MPTDNANERLARIINEYGDAVYRMSLSRCGDRETASDVYQQTFMLLLEKKPRFADKAQLRRWLLSAARKLTAASMRRAENKNLPLDAAEGACRGEAADFELYDLISALPETLRGITLLFYVEDMSVKDAADALGISTGAAKSRLKRARAELAKIYKEEIL